MELALLSLLKEDDMYGYQLSQEVSLRSGKRFEIKETSMYAVLYRLLEKGFVSDRKVVVGEKRTRVYYHLEDLGCEYLKEAIDEYLSTNKGIMMLLGISSLEVDESET